MIGTLLSIQLPLILLITLSPLAIADNIKIREVCLYSEDKYQVEATNDNEYSGCYRKKRDVAGTLGCTFIPALAIYNYVTHSHCDQADKLWRQISHWFSDDNQDKVVLIASNSPLLEPHPALPQNNDDQANSLILTLTKIDTQLHNQALTLPATARFCKTSIDNILAARYPRSPDENCPQWVSRILADFTLLFGDTVRDWTPQQLQNVVTRIDRQQSTGYAGNDETTENRLVTGLSAIIQQLGLAETLQQITRAFRYAQLNYANYIGQNPSTTESPGATQSLPLGEYSLSLESYRYPAEPHAVRIRHNNEWVTRPDLHFEVEIIDASATDRSGIILAHTVMDQWFTTYLFAPLKTDQQDNPLTDLDRTTSAARTTSISLLLELENTTSDYLFVVVRLEGEIVSMLGASSGNATDEFYIDVSVSAPRNVLTPNAEGNVRGAGSVAVHELARYLKENGVKFLRFRAPSQPAARVSTKLGFHHDEF
ncbi:GNAT family N-acetyltransferase [Yersinia sp. 1252 StPb PI]|uniref:GNAT family N-acetyltransferase n=1 Tax=Yersinia sp. 1252 StPb PI TaxID=3117404 RepID=UPI003B28A1BA